MFSIIVAVLFATRMLAVGFYVENGIMSEQSDIVTHVFESLPLRWW